MEVLEYLHRLAERVGVHAHHVAEPSEGDIRSGDLRLHYLDWGNDHLPPIVFLHGGGLTSHTWDAVCLALRAEYHCLALDQRGHGDSDWADDYGVEGRAGDVEAFVRDRGLDDFVLVGMSMGGIAALGYAARRPETLRALVIVDVGPEVQTEGAKRITSFMAQPSELDSVDDFVERALEFNPLRDRELLRFSLLHNLRKLPSGKWTWKYDTRPRSHPDPDKARTHSRELWDVLDRISCPTLVMRGEHSDVFHRADAERLAAALPHGSWIEIEGAGHTIQGDNPTALVAALRTFLADASA
jgi:pimeloyl-ACP methyl ester carboxylesterase